jgi:hypothetical protein
MIGAAIIATFLAQAADAPCDGFYSYVPDDIQREVAFSVEVRDNRFVEVLFSDYGNMIARAQPTPMGVNFSESGGIWRLTCAGDIAQLVIPADQWSPERTFALQKTAGDVWSVAREKGWNIGD